jgi:hypothetical protein
VEIATKVLGVAIESFFKKPTLYKDAHCDDIAQKCFEAYSSYGLRASQILIRKGDSGFNYELSFTHFNGNGTFKISAEKLEIHFQNAIGEKDVELVADCIAKLYEHVPLPEIATTTITANAHATAASIEAAHEYLSKYANSAKQIVRCGAIAYILCKNWKEEIRLMVDNSLVYPGGLFLMWSTSLAEGKLSREVIKTLGDACSEAAERVDLTFPRKDA